VKQIQPGQQHIIIAGRDDGAVGLFYARDPLNWLAAIGTHFALADVEVRPGTAAVQVVEEMRAQFAFAHLPGAALPWYLIDYRQAIDALNARNLDTGELRRLALQSEVMVFPNRDRGRVMGYTRGGQVVVRLHTSPFVANVVIASAGMVKPVLRARAST
jgi:hypothetical protein